MTTTKMRTRFTVASTLLALSLSSLGGTAVAQTSPDHLRGATAAQASEATTRATEGVWKRHIEAWGHHDLDAIMRDYNKDAVLVLNNQTYVGKAEIRKVFERLFEIFGQGENPIDTPTIKDRIVYITWHFAPNGRQAVFGTDSFVIEDDAISYQTIASPLYETYPVAAP
ncbi:hypothetical protein Stsp01_53490 [Streptomyces sp. NBRC 13847]|uniref:nuclear transport factor 2 family protein n=1 Tax=Streptomyces TaxID=1883 RepID=UPI0024A30120|nr:nuclear transport factor 2 family protein [Streptomyces sp. NBRC 13847]GLW18606.1 hypothetical protein Stsp01_53490 [Streptomyces sp. NBRC 13847]